MKNIIEIKRASESTIETLIKLGLLYVGEDNQLHVVDYATQRGANENE